MAQLGRASGAKRLVALGTPSAWLDDTASDSEFAAYLEKLRNFDFSPNRASVFSAHQMGTARAGKDATTCVCDPWGRVCTGSRANHMDPIEGLYVADTSLFPTAVGVNPMVTAMTMAGRVARTVHEDAAPG
jgi:choline dehydrogenase-like flavoprotein